MSFKDFAYIGVIAALIVFFLMKGCGDKANSDSFIKAINDTLRIERNDKGQEIAKKLALVGTIEQLNNIVAGKDSALKELQSIVNKRTITATVISSVTSNTISIPTVIKNDPIIGHDSVKVYPVYYTNFKNNWESFDITAFKDSFQLKYSLYNKFDVQNEWTKFGINKLTQWKEKGLFKKPTVIISVTNLNPHTETLELQSFVKPVPKQYKWVYVVGGVISGVLLKQYVLK